MQALAIHTTERDYHRSIIDETHRLRARVFADRLGWEVATSGGREKDCFDELDVTTIVALTDYGVVAGCARLLPATGPTMVADVFPQLLDGKGLGAHDGMIESSRFCVDTSLATSRGGKSLHEATLTMLAGIIEWSMANRYSEIVTVTDTRFERILGRASWPLQRIGAPRLIGEVMSVAGTLPVDRASFLRLRPPRYRSEIAGIQKIAA